MNRRWGRFMPPPGLERSQAGIWMWPLGKIYSGGSCPWSEGWSCKAYLTNKAKPRSHPGELGAIWSTILRGSYRKLGNVFLSFLQRRNLRSQLALGPEA